MKKFLLLFYSITLLFCAGVSAQAATEIRDTETESVLMELITPITRAAGIADGRVRLHIIGDDDFNAFVSNGEDIFVYTGLLIRIKSANALQAVVAHEMGHMIGGHMAQMSARMKAEMTRSLIMQVLGVGLMVANPMAGAGLLAGSQSVAKQSMLSFSRDEERLADDAAINLLVKAKLDSNGLIEVLEQMQEITGAAEARINPNNANHPLTAERLKNVREKIKESKKGQKTNGESYELIRAKLIGYLQKETQVETKYPSKDTGDPAVYAHSIRFMRSGNLQMAKTGAQTLISRHPDNPFFYELLGDIEYQFGHYDDSVKAYEKTLDELKAKGTNAPQIETALALVLSERKKPGDNERAIELSKRAILSEPIPLSYWVLAKAFGDKDGRSDWARAEYYNLMKNEKQMKRYAKSAREKLQKNSPEYLKAGDLLNKKIEK
ncbi:MAG: M48 family metalloprotease [Alphaproteobacteria bacterium]|nr:M48 family metalloprotease [Alphaproteobacteria bacterium]